LCALTVDRQIIERKLAFGIAIARPECFTKSRLSLYQLTFIALWAFYAGWMAVMLRLIVRFNMMAFREMAATDKHTKTSLTQHQFMLAFGTSDPQMFYDMSILMMKWAKVITNWVVTTPQKRAMFAMPQYQRLSATRTRLALV
jgi:hypothetical protein